MPQHRSTLTILPCMDSDDMATSRQQELSMSHENAAMLGSSAVDAARQGFYTNSAGEKVDWRSQIEHACSTKKSIRPDSPLPARIGNVHAETRIQVCNETTLQAALRLIKAGHRPLALNFANGEHAGGGFLHGALAQEEVLCRSSALYMTLKSDSMYEYHRPRPLSAASDWVIYSPDVPVFRTDDGTVLDRPWLLCFITAAAPFAPVVGQPEAGDLLGKRIYRVLEVACAYGHEALVLGAWGCGAFENDPYRTAIDFRTALETEFSGCFSDVVFAITDWSPERKSLGSFRDVFNAQQLRYKKA